MLDDMGIVNNVYRLWRFYQGMFYDCEGGRITLGGEELDISQLGCNEFRARLQLLKAISINEFDWDAQGADDSQDTLEAVKIGNAMGDWIMDAPEYRVAECISTMKEHALVYRVGYTASVWDPFSGEETGGTPATRQYLQTGEGQVSLDYEYAGEFSFFNFTLFDAIFSPTVPYRKRPWIYFRERRNVYDLAEIHWSQRKEILELAGSGTDEERSRFYGMERGLVTGSDHDTDYVDKWWFFHLPTPGLRSGRFTCNVGDVVLYDGPFPRYYGYDRPRLPIARCLHSRMLGTDILGHSPAVDLAPLQEALNIELSTILTNHRKFGRVKIWKQSGDNIAPSMLEPNETILECNTEPKVIDLLKTAPELLQGVDLLLGRMDSVSGVSAASRGLADKEVPGIRAALDDQKTIQNNGEYDDNIKISVEDIGQTVLEIAQTTAGDGRLIPVISEDDVAVLQKFTSENLKLVRRMLVKPGNPMLRTPSGRMALVEYMMKIPGMISNEKQLDAVLQGAPMKRLTAPRDAQIRLAREENARMKRGEQVVGSVTDDHLLHIMEVVSGIIGSVDVRYNEPVLLIAMPHLLWHLQQLTSNPIAQALMLALNWAPPQQVAALAQMGAMMLPMGEPQGQIEGPAPQGGGGNIIPGPGHENPAQGAEAELQGARDHLKREAMGAGAA